MATNKVLVEGNQFSIEVPNGTASGDALMVGDLPAVALRDEVEGETTVDTRGVYLFDVSSSAGVGDIVYLADGELSTDDSSGKRFGYALEEAESGDEIKIKVGY